MSSPSKHPPTPSSSTTTVTLTPVTLNSIDTLTISYLKGEITFQQYESMIENQHFQNELVLNQLNTSQMDRVLFTPDSTQVINTIELYSFDPSAAENSFSLNSNDAKTGRKSSSPTKNGAKRNDDESLPQTSKGSPTKKIKKKNRFWNIKNILSDSEPLSSETQKELGDVVDEDGSDEKISSSENDQDDDDDDSDSKIDDFDETSNWNDFDIETLNFDKFIKDHQITNRKSQINVDNLTKMNAEDAEINSKSSGNIFNKRKKDDQVVDPVELKAKRRRNRVLPIEIQGLMGEANLAYARGDSNKAIDTCLEVIKYAPRASEPFQLLSLLYSEIGQNDKALRVGLIAAQLNKDPDEWIELIQQALIEGENELTLFCYNNAIQCNPKNIKLHLDRISLLEDNKDVRRLILAKLMLLKYVDVNENLDVYQKFFNQVLNQLGDEPNDRNKKVYVLKNDMRKFQDKFLVENLKLLTQLLMEQKSYREAILILMNQAKIKAKVKNFLSSANEPGGFQYLDTLDSFENLNDYQFEIPAACNSYVRVQFIACLINLNYDKDKSLVSAFYQSVTASNNIEKYGCEFLLIADTYYIRKSFADAKKFYFTLLTNVKEYIVQLNIWLRYGNCCNYLNEIEDAINAYRNAVNLDTSNVEAALCLVNILKKNSLLFDEANTVIKNTLSQRTKSLTPQILNLMINQCLIQFDQNNLEQFIINAKQVLFADFDFVLENDVIYNLLRVDSRVQRALIFHQALEKYNYEFNFNYNKLNTNIQNTIFEIYLKLCKVLVSLKGENDLLTYSVGATVLPMVYERKDWNKSINFTCLVACILKNDGKNAFNILKDFILEFKNSNKLWSYVGIVIGLCPSLSQQKFFIRLGAKYMDHLPLCMINAHFAIMSGTYRYALVEYMNCFKQCPFDPFINLIIAITYCHISCQKFNTRRHLLVSQAFVFLRRYIKFRGICQETYFNVARIMHQLSLFDLAVHFYKKCLDLPCTFPDQKEIYDLKRFAAYNLVTIYKHNGANEMARNVMRKYLTI